VRIDHFRNCLDVLISRQRATDRYE
jgi:hypothetical protein